MTPAGRHRDIHIPGKKGLIMTGRFEGPEYHISKNRLETLVDGIFAIAMTLLVLGINPPRAAGVPRASASCPA